MPNISPKAFELAQQSPSSCEFPCLHTGLSSDYAEVIWNDDYRVPSDANDDVCDYPLARNQVLLTVAVACEAIVSFIAADKQRSFTITLKDLAVQNYALTSN